MSTTAGSDVTLDVGAKTHRGWIQSPPYDLALFVLAPIAGILVVGAGRLPGGYRLGLLATFFVAIPHYMSSFSFYLGDDNAPYFRQRWMAFFLGPAIIFALVAGLRLAGYPSPVLIAMFVWNVWHVSLQSAGILTIYRRLNDGPPAERPAAHLAILAVSATMAFWYLDRFKPLYDFVVRIHPQLPLVTRVVLAAVAVVALVRLAHRIARREKPMSLPESAFLATSLLLFHPYLWVKDSQQATFAMLMGHFIQYLSIVWLLNRRKYAHAGGSARQRLLAWMSSRPTTIGMTIGITGLAFYVMQRTTTALGLTELYLIIWNAMTLVHFYVDGLVWAFRTPHVRQSVGPYLFPPSRIAL